MKSDVTRSSNKIQSSTGTLWEVFGNRVISNGLGPAHFLGRQQYNCIHGEPQSERYTDQTLTPIKN
jgi:hypothetical protein